MAVPGPQEITLVNSDVGRLFARVNDRIRGGWHLDSLDISRRWSVFWWVTVYTARLSVGTPVAGLSFKFGPVSDQLVPSIEE